MVAVWHSLYGSTLTYCGKRLTETSELQKASPFHDARVASFSHQPRTQSSKIAHDLPAMLALRSNDSLLFQKTNNSANTNKSLTSK
jgi:hypothetical protein